MYGWLCHCMDAMRMRPRISYLCVYNTCYFSSSPDRLDGITLLYHLTTLYRLHVLWKTHLYSTAPTSTHAWAQISGNRVMFCSGQGPMPHGRCYSTELFLENIWLDKKKRVWEELYSQNYCLYLILASKQYPELSLCVCEYCCPWDSHV